MKTLLAVAISAGLLAAQQQDKPLLLKATTRLVLLSVIAQGHGGHADTTLHKEDFRVRVNGKPQTIGIFSMETAGALASSVNSPAQPAVPNAATFSNRYSNGAMPSGVTVILFDTRNTRAADQIYAKAQIIRYLRTLKPTDHVGLYTFGGSLKVLHDYTSDSAALLQRLNSDKRWNLPDTSREDALGALQTENAVFNDLSRAGGGTSPAERSFYTADRVLATLRTFEFIAEHMAQLPGRKNLIWVSGGFPLDIGFDSIADWHNPAVDQRTFTEEVDRTLRAMNDANIAVYPVDARGLMTDPRFSAAMRSAPRRPTMAPPIGVKEQQTMQTVASRTGGRAFYNTNDIAHAIDAAAEDSRVTYTIGFYPSDDRFDGKFHKIDVDLPNHPGVKLRYRKGYFDIPIKPEDEKSRQAELRDAVWSPIDATSMGVTASVKPAAGNPSSLDITMKVDHSSIGLRQEQSHWQGRLDVLFVQRDDQGREYGGTDDTVQLNLSPETYQKLIANDLGYHRVIARAPAAKLLRIVVRDASSGAMGSVTVPLSRIR
jgi:VWFA-related protein